MTATASGARRLAYASKEYEALSDRALSDLARAGDRKAAWALTYRVEGVIQVCVGRGVSRAVAKQTRLAVADHEDLCAYAREEVAKAMGSWRAGDGEAFHLRDYAATVVTREVNKRLRLNDTVQVDPRTSRSAEEYAEQAWLFAEERGREPEPHELAALVGKPAWVVEKALNWRKAAYSMEQDCRAGGNKGRRFAEPATEPDENPDNAYEKKDLKEVLLKRFSELPTRQQLILVGLYELDGQPKRTVTQLCAELKCSRHQFDKEHWQALAFLRTRVKR